MKRFMKRLKKLKVEITKIEGNVAKWEMLLRLEPLMYILTILISFSSIPIATLIVCKTNNVEFAIVMGVGILALPIIGLSILSSLYAKKVMDTIPEITLKKSSISYDALIYIRKHFYILAECPDTDSMVIVKKIIQ